MVLAASVACLFELSLLKKNLYFLSPGFLQELKYFYAVAW